MDHRHRDRGLFAIPLLSTLLYTLRADDGGLTIDRWVTLFSPEGARLTGPIWVGLGNSLVLAVVTVLIVLLLLAPTMILVNLRFGRLRPGFEFVVLLPISIPAIVLVVGLAPIYQQIGRSLGTGAWTLAFAYGITVLPFAYRAIQASIDAVDMRTLAEAARSLGAGWEPSFFASWRRTCGRASLRPHSSRWRSCWVSSPSRRFLTGRCSRPR